MYTDDLIRNAFDAFRSNTDDTDLQYENIPEERQCSICLNVIEANTQACILPCNHTFHINCIRNWMLRSPSCPVCRARIQSSNMQNRINISLAQANIKITFVYNDLSINTVWKNHNTIIDILEFVSKLDGVDSRFQIINQQYCFKNTESYDVLNRNLNRCGIIDNTTFTISNQPNIIVLEHNISI